MALATETCEACTPDAPQVTVEEMEDLLPQVPGWSVVERESIPRLEREFKFPDFETALEFTNGVGAIAEDAGHHPAILTEWGSVTVTLWTHAIRGLHRNDFRIAARVSALYAEETARARGD